MSYQSLAFFTGLFSSLHCVIMCGPLVMAIPFPGKVWFCILQKIMYQSGRIFTYSILGLLAGLFGTVFNILGLQQILSLVSGGILLFIGFYQFSGRKRYSNKRYDQFIRSLGKFMGRYMGKPYGGFLAGSLHGLIPCGMVYMAISGSLNAGSALAGTGFMFFFGLGTTPLLMLTAAIPVFIRRFRAPRIMVPALYLIASLFLIFRALNLQIPHITSPVPWNNEAPFCNSNQASR